MKKSLHLETSNPHSKTYKHFKYTIDGSNVKMGCFNEEGKNSYNSEISIDIVSSIVANTRKLYKRKKVNDFFTNPLDQITKPKQQRKIVKMPEGVPFEEVC